MSQNDRLKKASLVAHALSSETRLFILLELLHGAKRVDELAAQTIYTVPNCSQHLQVLKRAQLVNSTRHGQAVYYELSDKKLIKQILDILIGSQ